MDIKDAFMVFSGFHGAASRCVPAALAASPFVGDVALLDMFCYAGLFPFDHDVLVPNRDRVAPDLELACGGA